MTGVAETGVDPEGFVSFDEAWLDSDSLLPREVVMLPNSAHIPSAWRGRKVLLEGMTAADRDAYEASLSRTEGKGKNSQRVADLANVRAKLVSRCLRNPDGSRPQNIAAVINRLGKEPACVIEPLVAVAQRLSGMSDEDLERLEGNSDSDPGADS